jgi:hypothetical protein
MRIVKSMVAAAFAVALTATAHAQNVLYQHNFDGSAAATLHTLAPDVNNNGGGTTWVTRTDTGLRSGTGLKWFDDGTISATPTDRGQRLHPHRSNQRRHFFRESRQLVRHGLRQRASDRARRRR